MLPTMRDGSKTAGSKAGFFSPRMSLGLGDLEGLAVVYLTRIYKAAHDLETLMLNEADLVRSRRAAR